MDLHAQLSSQRDSGVAFEDEGLQQHTLPVPQPTEPPFAAPRRVPTPDGVLSWPGPTPLPRFMQQSAPVKQPSNLRIRVTKYIVRHPKGYCALILRKCGFRPAIPKTQAWRPSMSGHTTFRYGDVGSHPFNFGSGNGQGVGGKPRRDVGVGRTDEWQRVLRSPGASTAVTDERPAAHDTEQIAAVARGASQPHESAPMSSNVTGESNRACRELAAPTKDLVVADSVAGDAVPHKRSSSVPASGRSTYRSGHERRSTFPNNTVTTLELLAAFPEPPAALAAQACHARGKLTLFPRSSDENSPPKPGHLPVGLRGQADECAVYSSDNAHDEPIASGALGHADSVDEALRQGHIPSLIRGEDAARYRESGIPIYTPETSSLHSLDQARDEAADQNLALGTKAIKASVQSGRTAASRYFSAASRALPSRAKTTTPPATVPVQSQRERAVADGALRFNISRDPVQAPAAVENLVPVTVTRYGRRCPHKRSLEEEKRSSRVGGFDGVADGREMKMKKERCVRCRAKHQLRRVFGRRA